MKLNARLCSRQFNMYILALENNKTKAWDFVCFDLIELKRSVLVNNSYSIYVFKGVGRGTTLSPGLAGSRMIFQWRWTGTTQRKRVQERLCITVLLLLWIWEYSYCLLEQGRRPCHQGVSFFWVGAVCGGVIVYVKMWMGYSVDPPRTLWSICVHLYDMYPLDRADLISTLKAR
jgi:hypothetical protein